MIGDGELILASFLVVTPSIMDYYKSDFTKKDQEHKKIFYLLLFVTFLNSQLILQLKLILKI